MDKSKKYRCEVCGQNFAKNEVIAGVLIRDSISWQIKKIAPAWSGDTYICLHDLSTMRANYVHEILESEKGELSSLEQEVLQSLKANEILSSNIDALFEKKWTFGEKLADKIATFGGSWYFLSLFSAFLAFWIAINSFALLNPPVDPYPYILLNLLLSCLAAIQAPIIMMSQNRQEAKDRLRSEHDYQINLKAELEIRHLHEKVDHLLSHQWERLVEIQQMQLELLSELERKNMKV